MALHFVESDDGFLPVLVDVNHLPQDGPVRVIIAKNGVTEEEGEGLVAHEGTPVGDGIAESVELLLPDKVDGGHVRDEADFLEQLRLALFFERQLQLVGGVEVFLDGAFAAADDHEDVGDATVHAFLHHVLDGGGVHNGQHFLGLRLGGGQEAGAESGGWNDGFGDGHREEGATGAAGHRDAGGIGILQDEGGKEELTKGDQCVPAG